MTTETDTSRKSTVDYWNENWHRASGNTRDSYFRRRLDRSLAKAFAKLPDGANQLIEIGAGGSEYLPYLHRRFGFQVTGLDYAEKGCETAREMLERAGVIGVVHRADMFHPPPSLVGQFDAVVSFGLVEHFSDTTNAVAACAAFARPGGLIVTVIPNMKGLYGVLYRYFDRKVFDIHVPLNLDDLVKAHLACGLNVTQGECILGLPGVIDGGRVEPLLVRRILRKLVYWLSRLYWGLEERGIGVPENGLTSPYLLCAARVPEIATRK